MDHEECFAGDSIQNWESSIWCLTTVEAFSPLSLCYVVKWKGVVKFCRKRIYILMCVLGIFYLPFSLSLSPAHPGIFLKEGRMGKLPRFPVCEKFSRMTQCEYAVLSLYSSNDMVFSHTQRIEHKLCNIDSPWFKTYHRIWCYSVLTPFLGGFNSSSIYNTPLKGSLIPYRMYNFPRYQR